MQVAKNVTRPKRERKEPDVRGERVPLDKPCPNCEVKFMGEHQTFAYQMNVGGRSFVIHHCHWCRYQGE